MLISTFPHYRISTFPHQHINTLAHQHIIALAHYKFIMLPLHITDRFAQRHIGIGEQDLAQMLGTIGVGSLDQLIDETVPSAIRMQRELDLPEALSEYEYLLMLQGIAAKNKDMKSYIGLGYYGTITPSPILRNVFQNPGWYTQYTPYQAEIAQGRLEALLNYQTLVSDLTGMPIANASLLDEGTAAAEAMAMLYGVKNKRPKGEPINQIWVSNKIYPQTLDVLITRAAPIGVEVIVADEASFTYNQNTFAIVLQYPAEDGSLGDPRQIAEKAQAAGIHVIVAADLLSLALLTPPAEWGADVVVGNTQRFGVPMGLGGPHAAYFACKDDYKRIIPGRIIGVSVDNDGKRALRMALQTREQHIRRDKATSNICTAQALLAIMASMYAVYHGEEGIRNIAARVHGLTLVAYKELKAMGFSIENATFFDTLRVDVADADTQKAIEANALAANINFYYPYPRFVQLSIDETTTLADIATLLNVFAKAKNANTYTAADLDAKYSGKLEANIPAEYTRTSRYLTHEVFNAYRSESQLMRYIKRLENKDLSLVHSMISLGSCTMKLNAASEMLPVSWAAFANVHPFVPANQIEGYLQIFAELEAYLADITGFTACSLQGNSGAQGEYTGMLAIRAYHLNNKDTHRNIALIPASAHGTNPATAVMVGMQVVVVACDERGNVDFEDLKAKVETHKANLAALMITYPSTHGVFETTIKDICQLIHDNGGLVYMDGANMNAQVGLTSPGLIGADVCHLNLHKTFAIPHGGGGPGMGPICVNDKLKPFLPRHHFAQVGGEKAISSVSSAPWGSASILLISYGYIRMLGKTGCKDATKYAILNANYMKARLESAYKVLYVGEFGRAAHEMILDLRPFKDQIAAEDVAKRLMDYGFHAPTLSFPVAGTIMIEPTESEDKAELDRFCDALLQIRAEIDEIAEGKYAADNNVLHNAPHTQALITATDWHLPYSREKAAFPLPFVRERKFWATTSRINNAYGDKNLVCTCLPIEYYAEDSQLVN
jgi:glycine dehydrogenase